MNIEDAVWVRDKVLPLALESERWNVVVFETFRAVELLLKGLMCLSGHAPRKSHEAHILVDDFVSVVDSLGDQPPFVFTSSTTMGNIYGLRFDGRRFELVRSHQGTYTALGHLVQERLNAIDRLVTLRLEIDGSIVRVLSGERLLLSTIDGLATERNQRGRTVFSVPDAKAVDVMKACAGALRSRREDAFYSTAIFGPTDAEEAMKKMGDVFDASLAFILLN